jgi:hypothetical protein
VAGILTDHIPTHGGVRRLADQPDPVLPVAADLVVLDEGGFGGLADRDTRFPVVVDVVAADDVLGGCIDVDAVRRVGEGVVSVDQVSIRAQVENDPVVFVAVDDVVPDDAAGSVLGQDDSVLAVVVHHVALDEQAM